MKPPVSADTIIAAIATCRAFIGSAQIRVMSALCRGEEGDWFREKFVVLQHIFNTMPKVYEQESLGGQAIIHLHYFSPAGDWYITERDIARPQHQAFGLADPFGDGGELGYISILELIRCGVEIDLHWKPITLDQARMRKVVRDEIARGAAPAIETNQTIRELSGKS